MATDKKIVMFDFDGVLINTIEHSYNIHKINNPDLSWERFQSYHDGNFFDGYGKAVETGEHIPADDFLGEYNKAIKALSINEILHDCVIRLSESYILVIVSSTRSSFISDFLEKEGLSKYFIDIFGADIHTSKIVKIKSVLEKYSVGPNNCVFITDTLGDIKEAKECGVLSVAVTWGVHRHEKLKDGNPIAIVDDPSDLARTIEDVLK